MIEVININADGLPTEITDVYIGRANPRKGLKASALANPFKIEPGCTREESINLYRARLEMILFGESCPVLSLEWDASILEFSSLRRLHKKHGKLRLFCWCAPLPCHGDIIKDFLKGSV